MLTRNFPHTVQGHQEVTQRTTSQIQEDEMSFLRRQAGLILKDGESSSDIWRELREEPLLLHLERNQLRWFGHQIRLPPGGGPTFGGFPGTTNWEETLGQTHNSWERLHISSGLGTPRDPPGGAGKHTQPAVAVT